MQKFYQQIKQALGRTAKEALGEQENQKQTYYVWLITQDNEDRKLYKELIEV